MIIRLFNDMLNKNVSLPSRKNCFTDTYVNVWMYRSTLCQKWAIIANNRQNEGFIIMIVY